MAVVFGVATAFARSAFDSDPAHIRLPSLTRTTTSPAPGVEARSAVKPLTGRALGIFNLFTYFEAPYHVTDYTPWNFIVTHGLTPDSIRDQTATIPENWWYEP